MTLLYTIFAGTLSYLFWLAIALHFSQGSERTYLKPQDTINHTFVKKGARAHAKPNRKSFDLQRERKWNELSKVYAARFYTSYILICGNRVCLPCAQSGSDDPVRELSRFSTSASVLGVLLSVTFGWHESTMATQWCRRFCRDGDSEVSSFFQGSLRRTHLTRCWAMGRAAVVGAVWGWQFTAVQTLQLLSKEKC